MPKTNNRHSELHTLLTQLNLTAMADVFADVALRAAKEGLSHEAYLYELARQEWELRTQRRTARLVRQSGLPVEKTFRTLALSRLSPTLQLQLERLKSASFLETATNIIAIGKPGVGKSHALAAVGYELIEAGYPVLWTPTSALVQRLLAAKRDLRLPQELAKLDKFACVILDDIGYVQHDRDEMEVLFTFLAERYERKSVMITTNLVFSEWERIFKDPMTTMAAIDRLVHHSIILDMMSVESYRAEVASLQHLSSARPKKSSSRHASHDETVVSLQGSDASSGVTSPFARKTTPASLLVPDATPAPLLVAENASGDPFSVDITSAHLIATNGTV
jgi:DNA replication protein DnaC